MILTLTKRCNLNFVKPVDFTPRLEISGNERTSKTPPGIEQKTSARQNVIPKGSVEERMRLKGFTKVCLDKISIQKDLPAKGQ